MIKNNKNPFSLKIEEFSENVKNDENDKKLVKNNLSLSTSLNSLNSLNPVNSSDFSNSSLSNLLIENDFKIKGYFEADLLNSNNTKKITDFIGNFY